jgi:hypothetical protein
MLGVVVLVLLGSDETHLFNVAGLLMSVAIVFGVAIVAAGLIVLALRSVQHKRAATGACLTCEFRCQHAMTPAPQRGWLISTAERPQPQQKVFVPMPRVPVRDQAGPRWPERPLIGAGRSES